MVGDFSSTITLLDISIYSCQKCAITEIDKSVRIGYLTDNYPFSQTLFKHFAINDSGVNSFSYGCLKDCPLGFDGFIFKTSDGVKESFGDAFEV